MVAMRLDKHVCMWCGACVGVCPVNSIVLYETRIEFQDHCTDCLICERMCPVGAIYHVDENNSKIQLQSVI